MLNDKFLEGVKSDESLTPVQHREYCRTTPLDRVFACGCCIIVVINAIIWTYLYY